MRRQVPPEKTKDVLEFATMKPADRLASIERGLQVRTLVIFLVRDHLCAFPN